eukprot:7856826-Alexandrium_andersonii.AAC.1
MLTGLLLAARGCKASVAPGFPKSRTPRTSSSLDRLGDRRSPRTPKRRLRYGRSGIGFGRFRLGTKLRSGSGA